ncbi:hypothetical protein PG999_010341 [Apiospora kogelbergensis]|uniref:Uncharacterized protein n=1 Tax=Apiospora kogelbergensis TaxID=1337665 RepID=A0AAW0QBZ3_9PEZI
MDKTSRIFLRNAGAPTLWAGREPPKTIISRNSLTALLRCSVHVIPIGVTGFLAWLNLTGYFLGDQLAGGAANHDRDQLLLQIAAKITEIAMVASLSTTIMCTVRAEAMSKEGVPLGLLSSPFRFNNMNYFWSTAFLAGATARSKNWFRRVSVVLLIFACGVLAVVVGPSVALLMIPSTENAWPAGGTDFWLLGTSDTLWPDAINVSHVGGDFCLHPDETNIKAAVVGLSSCPWNGYTQLAKSLQDRNIDWQSNFTFIDGVVKRQVTRHQVGADMEEGETWAFGPHVATASFVKMISHEWVLATQIASSAQRPGSNSNLKNATTGMGEAHAQSWLPTSRVRCWSTGRYENQPSTGTSEQQLLFPLLPEFGSSPQGTGNNWNVSATIGRRYKDKSIATHWVDVPAPNAENHLGAAIIVETSYQEQYGTRAIQLTPCSLDIRWAMGTNIGSGLPGTDNMVVYGALKALEDSSTSGEISTSWAPTPGPDWRFAAADRAWLETLLPLVEGTREEGWTTAAAMFAHAGSNSSAGLMEDAFPSLPYIESTLATLVVDGMSRIGLNENMQRVNLGRYNGLRTLPQRRTDPGAYFDKLLAGETVVVPPPGVAADAVARLRWDVRVSGLAYGANSTAAYLALAVLLACSAIAVGHGAYVLATRRSSEAWDCVEELVLLSQLSRPSASAALVNTAGGIHRRAAYRVGAHILARRRRRKRVGGSKGDFDDDGEDLQLVLDPGEGDCDRLEAIREGVAYGKRIY